MENWPCTIEVREPTPTLNKTPITKLSLLKTPKRCSLFSVIAYLDMATFLKIKSNLLYLFLIIYTSVSSYA